MAEQGNRGRALRLLAGGAVGAAAVWAGCLVVAGVVLGAPALAWAVLGGLTTLAFFALGQFVQVLTAEAGTITVMVAAVSSYFVRAAGLAVVLIVVQPLATGPGSAALVPTLIAVVAGWLAGEIWTFAQLRVPVFDPPAAGPR